MTQAITDGAPLVWPAATDNIAARMKHGDAATCDAAFAKAAHIVSLDLENQRLIPATMEPRAALASFDLETGRVTPSPVHPDALRSSRRPVRGAQSHD